MRALVEQHLAEFDAVLAEAETASAPKHGNAVARALVRLGREKACQRRIRPQGILLALAENPHLLDPLREQEKRNIARIRRTAADRDLSLIALLALQGLFMHDLFEVHDLVAEEYAVVFERLMTLLTDEPSRVEGAPGP